MKHVRVAAGNVSAARVYETMASRVHEHVTGFLLCNAVFALMHTGIADDLAGGAEIVPNEIAKKRDLDPHQLSGLCKYLKLQEVLAEADGRYWLTPLGNSLFGVGARGVLELYRGGYGEVVSAAPALLAKEKVYGRDLVRDGKYVASGSAGFFRAANFPAAFAALDECGAKRVLDLGCGDASMLIDFCMRSPDHAGIGVDVDERAIQSATAAVASAGLSDRIRLVQADAFDLKAVGPLAPDVDAIYSFAMQHEMFRDGEQVVIDHLNELGEIFKGKSYVLGEPLINMTRGDSNFYWIHVLSLQGFPKDVAGWETLLGKCNLELIATFYTVHERLSNGAFFLLQF